MVWKGLLSEGKDKESQSIADSFVTHGFEETAELQLKANQEKNKLWKCYATILSYYVHAEHNFGLFCIIKRWAGILYYCCFTREA